MAGARQERAKPRGFAGELPATLNQSFLIDNADGFASIGFYVTPPTGGEVTFEGTFDGVNWDSITFRGVATDEYQQKTTVAGDFVGSISNLAMIRFRTSVGGSGPGAVAGRFGIEASTLEGIEFSNRPDKFGGVDVHVDFSSTSIQTNAVVWDPGAGRRFCVTDCLVFVHGTVDGNLSLFRDSASTGNYLVKGFMDPSVNAPIIIPLSLRTPFKGSAAGHQLKLTTSTALNLDLSVSGYTIPA